MYFINFTNVYVAKFVLTSYELPNFIAKHILPYILVIGLIVNTAFLFTVFRIKRMQTVPNCYLCIQTVADCAYLISQIGPTFWRVMNLHNAGPDNQGSWFNLLFNFQSLFKTTIGCFTQIFIYSFCYYISIGVVIAVSYDRYIAVVYPLQYQMLKSKKHIFKMVSGIFIFAFVYATGFAVARSNDTTLCYIWPNLPEFHSFHHVAHVCRKLFDKDITETLEELLNNTTFALAMTITIGFYSVIVYKLSSRKVAADSDQVKTTRNQVARMVIITGCIFFLCQLPFRVHSSLRLVARFSAYTFPQQIVRILKYTGYGTHLNVVLNAILYPTVNSTYRQAYFEAFSVRNTSRPKSQIKTTSAIVTEKDNDWAVFITSYVSKFHICFRNESVNFLQFIMPRKLTKWCYLPSFGIISGRHDTQVIIWVLILRKYTIRYLNICKLQRYFEQENTFLRNYLYQSRQRSRSGSCWNTIQIWNKCSKSGY